MEAELQSQIPGLDHVITEYSVVICSMNFTIHAEHDELMNYRAT